MSDPSRAAARFARLVEIMALLRSPEGCPWDREQTLASLRPYVLEEAYEVLDAIDQGDPAKLCEEIGDLVFEGVFLAQLASEDGAFDIGEALQSVIDKLVRRHPHVFERQPGGETPERVEGQWERIKDRERRERGEPRSVLAGVPRSLPALLRAHEIGSRVAAVGFDWPTPADVVDKLDEELDELRHAAREEGPARTEEELGDLLFSIVNLARKLGLEPESALRRANDKFAGRFERLEQRLRERGLSPSEASLEAMEREWRAVKDERADPAEDSDPSGS